MSVFDDKSRVVEPSSTNYISIFRAQWQSTGDFEYCIQLKDLLAATEKAGKQRLLTSYVHLTMFMDPKESVDEECIEQALMEIKVCEGGKFF